MKIDIIIERTNTGYSAFAEQHPVFTVGSTIAEIKENIIEALNLYFSEVNIKVSENDINLKFDMSQFFEYYNVINVKALSKRIGINSSLLAQYAKGIKNPSKKQSERILYGVQSLAKELLEVRF